MLQFPPPIQEPVTPTAGQVLAGNDASTQFETQSLGARADFLRVFGPALSRRWYENRCRKGATTRLLIGTGGAPALSGTIGTAAISSDGVLQSFTTAASAGAIAGGLLMDSEAQFVRSVLPRALFRIKASSSTTDLRIFVGITDTALGSADDPAAVAAVFRYSTSASDPGWVCVTRSAGLTVSDSVRAYTASEVLLMGIDFETVDTARFWIGTSPTDIAPVYSTTSNVFNIASAVTLNVSVGAVAASARRMDYDRAIVQHQ